MYGSVCTVVWEGRRRKASPYPDQCAHNVRLTDDIWMRSKVKLTQRGMLPNRVH